MGHEPSEQLRLKVQEAITIISTAAVEEYMHPAGKVYADENPQGANIPQ